MMPKHPTIKICPSCGNSFPCHGDSDCWCEQYKIHRRDMMDIIERYTDCLCPNCLKKYEKE